MFHEEFGIRSELPHSFDLINSQLASMDRR